MPGQNVAFLLSKVVVLTVCDGVALPADTIAEKQVLCQNLFHHHSIYS